MRNGGNDQIDAVDANATSGERPAMALNMNDQRTSSIDDDAPSNLPPPPEPPDKPASQSKEPQSAELERRRVPAKLEVMATAHKKDAPPAFGHNEDGQEHLQFQHTDPRVLRSRGGSGCLRAAKPWVPYLERMRQELWDTSVDL